MEDFNPQNNFVPQNNNSLPMTKGDPSKNKFAITSLVLSLTSILLFILLIPQVLGLIFGIKGIKSEKKGMAITGIVISSITMVMFVFGIISVIALNAFNGVLVSSKEKADIKVGKNLEYAISEYISDSKDLKLTMGTNSTQSVPRIIQSLQNKINMNGINYGPYLNNDESDSNYMPLQSLGWEVIVDKNGTAHVTPSKSESHLIFK